MSKDFPELVFLTGPQVGQRIALNRPVLLFGRGGQADVMLSEEFASRLQLRYERLQAGPTLENLSSRGTWINGRRYRTGKKILLETGDLIGIGQETQVLFVAAGDDVETAVDAFRNACPQRKDAFGNRLQGAALEHHAGTSEGGAATAPLWEEPAEVEELPAVQERKQREAEKRPSEMSAGERDEEEQRAKRKKMLIGLTVYWVLIGIPLVLAMIFIQRSSEEDKPEVPILDKATIAEHLRAPVERPRDALQAQKKLDEALGMYQKYGMQERHLHKVVAAFKEAMAYRNSITFDRPEHHDLYAALLDKHIRHFTAEYIDACYLEKSRRWRLAEQRFGELSNTLDLNNPLFRNVQSHYERCRFYRQKEEPKSRGLFE